MKIKEISFYDNFKCICNDCELDCCSNWLVPLEENYYKKYICLEGIDSLKAKLFIKKNPGSNFYIINKNFKTCPYREKDGLCHLQKKYGPSMLCDVCRDFPRITYNFGHEALRLLDLSCPEVVRLFLSNKSNINFVPAKKIEKIKNESYGTNDDIQYYDFLYSLLESILEIFNDEKMSLGNINAYLLKAAKFLQNAFVNGNLSYENDANSDSNNFSDSNSANINYSEINREFSSISKSESFYFSISTIDKIIVEGGYYHENLKRVLPILYKLCKSYFKKFGQMRINDINSIISSMSEELSKELNSSIRNYLKYNLLTYFMKCYEDYSFLRNITIPVIKTELMLIFLWLYEKDLQLNSSLNKKTGISHKKNSLDSSNNCLKNNHENIPAIISSIHRRGNGNDKMFNDYFNIAFPEIDKL